MKELQVSKLSENDIFVRLNSIFSGFDPNFNPDNINFESKLTTDLGINSIGMLYMAISIEEIFGINLEGKKFSDFVTVGDVIAFIKNKL